MPLQLDAVVCPSACIGWSLASGAFRSVKLIIWCEFFINSHESRSLANTFGAHVATLRYNNDKFNRSGCAGHRRFNSDSRTLAPISLAIPFFFFFFGLLREPGAAERLCATTKLNVIYHIAFGAYSLHFIGFSYKSWEKIRRNNVSFLKRFELARFTFHIRNSSAFSKNSCRLKNVKSIIRWKTQDEQRIFLPVRRILCVPGSVWTTNAIIYALRRVLCLD